MQQSDLWASPRIYQSNRVRWSTSIAFEMHEIVSESREPMNQGYLTALCTRLSLLDLIQYCVMKNVPFTVFEDWSSILDKVKEIVAGKTTVQQAAKEGYEQYQKETVANGKVG